MSADLVLRAARAAHEINRAFCKSIGDSSQPSWEDAPDWQKKSAITGVEFHIENPDATPESSHASWLKEKVDNGWVYGPVKDAEKKTHHCIVPYNELSQENRSKDYLFKAVVDVFVND